MTAKWGEITAGEIASPIHGKVISGPVESVFAGLSTDSRQIAPGQLFWAIRGERYDGHDFVKHAVDKGAAGLVIRRGFRFEIPLGKDTVVITVSDTLRALGDLAHWWRQQHAVCVVAITGSVGKTTTKEMAASILELGAATLKNSGNLNNLIGLPLTLVLLKEKHRKAVLEMGMNRPGEISRLTEITDPDVGLITNVAKAHLEGLGSIEEVAKAKVELLKTISSEGQVILNGDDGLLMRAASAFSRPVTTYGLGKSNDIRGRRIQNLGPEGIAFDLHYEGRSESIRLHVPGLQNVSNALAASAIAICLEESPEHIVKGLSDFEGVKGRFTVSSLPGGATLVDDTYNSNPASLKAALHSLKEIVGHGGRVIIGLGEMMELGDESVAAHLEAGGMVSEIGAHYFFAMGQHAQEMIEGALRSSFPPQRAAVVNTHEEMAENVRDVMKEGDVILLKGSRKMGLEKVAERLAEQ